VEPGLQPGGTLPDMETLDAAKMFLRKYNSSKNKPFFVAIGFHKPHIPIKFPRKFLSKLNI
jgi:iduronate 2-sulfatase